MRENAISEAGSGLQVVLPIAEFAYRQAAWQSRKTAIEALERVCGTADARVVATLVKMLDDKEASVREAVVRALEVVAPENDETTLTAVHTLPSFGTQPCRAAKAAAIS